jgi:hypothetical protein
MREAATYTFNTESSMKDQVRLLQVQVSKLFLMLQGRVSFGTGVDGVKGQNISGEWQEFTTSATPDAENTIAHTIGSVPLGYIVVAQNKAGSLYQMDDTGTAWTSTNIYLKCDVASVTFLVFLVKKGSVT